MSKSNKMLYQSSKYKAKVKTVEEFVERNLGKSAKDFIREKYPAKATLFSNLLNDELTIEEHNYLFKKLGSLTHLKNKRTVEEYACDLVLGWVVEDVVLEILNRSGLRCYLSSADRKREFLTKPRATPDIRVEVKSGPRARLELVKDFTGFWGKYQKIHLRDQKYKNLKKENGILVGIDFVHKIFFVLPLRKTDAKFIESHYLYGGKPVFEVRLTGVKSARLDEMGEKLPIFLEV